MDSAMLSPRCSWISTSLLGGRNTQFSNSSLTPAAPTNLIKNVEGPDNLHKEWVKMQGGKTNQGSSSQKTMMVHSLRKEASALLCEAVQGCTHIYIHISAYTH